MPDSRIDFSDIPESSDAELRRARRVGRPKSPHAKQLIAIRIDPRLLARLRRLAQRRQTPFDFDGRESWFGFDFPFSIFRF
jgi:uncharacterized protein (DUF4415 family)